MKTKDDLLEKLKVLIESSNNTQDASDYGQWSSEGLNIIKSFAGKESEFYHELKGRISKTSDILVGVGSTRNPIARTAIQNCSGIIKGFKQAVEGGWLEDQREKLRVELYSDMLELGQILLKGDEKGYQPAAVIFGMVLEDKLRKLCKQHQISMDDKETIETLNMKLYKEGVYKVSEKDRVTIVGRVRNHAGHARWEQFAKSEVEDMHRTVVNFLAQYD
jgi:hypothetical protein